MRKVLKIIGVVVGAFIVLVVILSIVDPSKKTPSATSSPTTTTTAPASTTTIAPTTTTQPHTATILSDVQGQGDESMPAFTIPSSASGWALAWSYNCSSYGSEGNFIVEIDGLGSTTTEDQGPNELGDENQGQDSYYDTGTFQFVVTSECNWAVTVVAAE